MSESTSFLDAAKLLRWIREQEAVAAKSQDDESVVERARGVGRLLQLKSLRAWMRDETQRVLDEAKAARK